MNRLNQKSEEFLVTFQAIVVDEVLYMIQTKNEIEKMESSLIKLQAKQLQQKGNSTPNSNKNAVINLSNDSTSCFTDYLSMNPDNSIVLKSLSEDLINKKMAMTDQMNKFESQKRDTANMIKGEDLVEKFLSRHLNFSLYEIQKKLINLEDYQILKKLDQIIVILANSARDQYSSYFSIKEKLKAKRDELSELTSYVKELKGEIDTKKEEAQKLLNELNGRKTEEAQLKEDQRKLQEELETKLLGETEKTYQSYCFEQDKKLKKLKF